MNTPTTGISKFLDRLLRPLFDKHVRSTTIIDGVDLIRRLETYVENGHLKPTLNSVHLILQIYIQCYHKKNQSMFLLNFLLTMVIIK
jgi:hypothetical protein